MNCLNNFSTQDILSALKIGGHAKKTTIETVLEQLTKCKELERKVFSYVRQNKGNRHQAEDIFQEGLMRLWLKLLFNKFEGKSQIEYFLYGICKKLWFNELRKIKRRGESSLDENPRPHHAADNEREQKELSEVLDMIIKMLPERCQKYLTLWAYDYTHQEIAEMLGVAERSSINSTSECKKKLRQLIEDNPDLGDLLA